MQLSIFHVGLACPSGATKKLGFNGFSNSAVANVVVPWRQLVPLQVPGQEDAEDGGWRVSRPALVFFGDVEVEEENSWKSIGELRFRN